MSAFDATLRRSPLEGVALPDGARELPFLAQLDVRGAHLAEAVRGALGFVLPTEPNRVAADGDLAALWLGPDEWLVVGPAGREADLDADLRGAVAPTGGSVVDVSANRTTIELSGARARELLESGCSIDLDPRAFGPGRCAQTLLAKTPIILWQTEAAPAVVYRILVRPSYAAFVAAWLVDADRASANEVDER